MEKSSRCRLSQPLAGAGILSLALIALATSWTTQTLYQATELDSPTQLAVSLCSLVGIVLAYRFPIYVRHNTKICVSSVPLYLIAVFLAPPLAAIAGGLGVAAGELLVRTRHANSLAVVATHTGRWMVILLLGSRILHVPLSASDIIPHAGILVAGAVVLLAGDLLTVPLALVPLTGEPVPHILLSCLRSGVVVEAAQYGVGMLGALVVERQAWALMLLAMPGVLLYLLYRKEVDAETYQLLETVADAVDLRDPYTVDHSRRVVELTRHILAELGRNGQEAELILAAARFHDVGKVEIPDHVLLKRGGLSAQERAVLEEHAVKGAELLQHYPDLGRIVEMVRHHHERWEGTGYPFGLKAADIPFGARIIAVAESVDAMISDRSYRPALSMDRAAEMLRNGRGRQWDPAIVDAFLHSCGEHLEHPVDVAPAEPVAAVPGALETASTA